MMAVSPLTFHCLSSMHSPHKNPFLLSQNGLAYSFYQVYRKSASSQLGAFKPNAIKYIVVQAIFYLPYHAKLWTSFLFHFLGCNKILKEKTPSTSKPKIKRDVLIPVFLMKRTTSMPMILFS